MSRFFETLQISDGVIRQPDLHQSRFDKTREDHYAFVPKISLSEEINVPEKNKTGLIRCRVDYDIDIRQIAFYPYEMSEHKYLRIIETGNSDYSYKYSDRSFFSDSLKSNPLCDDIIFTKTGYLTDATYSNIVFYQEGNWFTPDICLLEGTKRALLLSEKKIIKKSIHREDLINFEKIAFINAMRDFEKIYFFETTGDFLTLNPA